MSDDGMSAVMVTLTTPTPNPYDGEPGPDAQTWTPPDLDFLDPQLVSAFAAYCRLNPRITDPVTLTRVLRAYLTVPPIT